MELTEVNHGPPEVSNISPPEVSNIGPPEVPLGSEVFEVVNPCKTVDEEDMELQESYENLILFIFSKSQNIACSYMYQL